MQDTIYTKKYVHFYLDEYTKTLEATKARGMSDGAIKICEEAVNYYRDLADKLKKSEKV